MIERTFSTCKYLEMYARDREKAGLLEIIRFLVDETID
jgi:hypothetical protein